MRRLFRLAGGEWSILLRAWGLFLLADLALRVLPLKRLLAVCQQGSPRQDLALAPTASISRLVWLAEVASRYAPGHATCLQKALVLSWLLARRGIATTLRLGVARDNGALLSAHAWLERDGEVLGGPQAAGQHRPLLDAPTRLDRRSPSDGGAA